MKTSLLLLFFGISLSLHAQIDASQLGKINNYLPSSPDASSMTRHAGIPVNHSTGSLNLNIPLFNLNSGDLAVQTSISYTSGGVKVDEIASRVGLGWALNAGGVISRTILDDPDEEELRITAPTNLSARNQSVFDFLALATYEGTPGSSNGVDNQPDMFNFNFNGYSGKFIFDASGNVLQIPKSSLKIVSNIGSNSAWDFKITDPSGVSYYFGGDLATEKTKSTDGGGGYCARIYASPKATAWYLTRIEHPNGDYIQFNYQSISFNYYSSVSQTFIRTPAATLLGECSVVGQPPNTCPQIIENITCPNYLETNTHYLTAIISSKGGQINFTYTGSRADLNGDVALTKVELKNGATEVLRSIELTYSQIETVSPKLASAIPSFISNNNSLKNRMFLKAIEEKGSTGASLGKHILNYYSPTLLPARLSFAQDHYGYFNNEFNDSMIPASEDASWALLFSTSTAANRNPNPYVSYYGSLSSIKYPTGGKDSIYYEGHVAKVYEAVTQPNANAYATAMGYDDRGVTETYSSDIIIGTTQLATFSAVASFVEDSPDTYDGGLHNFARFSIIDQSNGSTVRYIAKLLAGASITDTVTLIAGRTYKLYVRAEGSMIRGDAALSYISGAGGMALVNKNIGGVRVKKIETYSEGVKQNYKSFFYNTPESEFSSGIVSDQPFYYSTITNRLTCPAPNPALVTCIYYSAHSNSINNLYRMGGAHIYYENVSVSYGDDNYVVGGEEFHYTAEKSPAVEPFVGYKIQGAPSDDVSWKNGLETYHAVFKKPASTKIILSETFKKYKIDASSLQEVNGYYIKADYVDNIIITPPTFVEFLPFHGSVYKLSSAFIHIDTLISKKYDSNGAYPVVELKEVKYDNPYHLLSSETTHASTGEILSKQYQYSSDYATIPDLETGQYALIQQLALSGNTMAPVSVEEKWNGTVIAKTRVNYMVNPASSKVVSQNVKLYDKQSGTMYLAVENLLYDTQDKLLQQHMKSGPNKSYKYGYNNQYLIAEVTNAAQNEFYHNDFEDSGVVGVSHTGNKHSGGGYSVSWTPPNSRSYVISYWYYAASKWKYKEDTYVPGYILSEGSTYDDITVYPKDAQIVTYTYTPNVGVTSQTDAKGLTVHYEYDDFQRLKYIKDREGNIVKAFDYHYAGG